MIGRGVKFRPSLATLARLACVFSTAELALGTPVTFALELPPEMPLTELVWVGCKGRVVRLEPRHDDVGFVMATRLEKFEYIFDHAPA